MVRRRKIEGKGKRKYSFAVDLRKPRDPQDGKRSFRPFDKQNIHALVPDLLFWLSETSVTNDGIMKIKNEEIVLGKNKQQRNKETKKKQTSNAIMDVFMFD